MSIKRVCLDKEGNVTEVEFWSEIEATNAAGEIAAMQRFLQINWQSGLLTDAQRKTKWQELQEIHEQKAVWSVDKS